MSDKTDTTLQFLLNDQHLSLSSVAADLSLLSYLREQKNLVGTKEGCAEGDCGACTVLVGRLLRGQLVYESVNACIRLLPSLHACHVVTIEYLKQTAEAHFDSKLHPVQQAMVDEHGSQCGFCTPGIVMSLYALWMENPAPDNAAIEIALQGNLCRCTGYEPIVQAARTAARVAGQSRDPLFASARYVQQQLQAMQCDKLMVFRSDGLGGPSEWIRPASETQIPALLSEHSDATLIAGCTDVGLWINKDFRQISPVISLSHLDSLHKIDSDKQGVTLGACVTYTEAMPVLIGEFPQLQNYWSRIGGMQIRNMGTVGGNIANGSPIGDTPPVLIALEAKLRLMGNDGVREIALQDFFIEYARQDLQPDEFVHAIHIPYLPANAHFSASKISKRRDEDISTLCCGFKLRMQGDVIEQAILAYGGMAGTPKRATATEELLSGQAIEPGLIKLATDCLRDEFTPLTDWRATAEYRRRVSANLLLRFLEQLQHDTEALT